MRELMEDLMAGDPLSEVLVRHRVKAIQTVVLLILLITAALIFVYRGEADTELTELAEDTAAMETVGSPEEEGNNAAEAGELSRAGSQESSGQGEGTAQGDGTTAPSDAALVYVDIGGAVRTPKLAKLPAGSRVEDAIEQAGGVTESADLTTINRAALLSDGDKIYIPKKGETDLPLSAQGTGGGGNSGSGYPGSASAGAGGSGSSSAGMVSASEGKVNLNTADLSQLQTLSGVGPVTAQKIIDYREETGGYGSVEDLKNVSGIGDKTFEKLKNDVTI